MDVNLGLWSVIGNLISRLLVRVWNIRGWNVRAWTVRALVIARAVVVLWVVGPLVIVRRVVVWIAIISVVLIRVIASAKIDSHASATECDANATVQPNLRTSSIVVIGLGGGGASSQVDQAHESDDACFG